MYCLAVSDPVDEDGRVWYVGWMQDEVQTTQKGDVERGEDADSAMVVCLGDTIQESPRIICSTFPSTDVS